MTKTQKTLLAVGIALLLVGLVARFGIPLLPSPGGEFSSTEPIAAVVIVYESADNTVAQAKTEAAVHAFCKTHSLAYRLVDKDDQDKDGNTPADEAPYIAKAQGKTLPQWFLIGPKGGLVSQTALPKSDTEATATLAKHTGGK